MPSLNNDQQLALQFHLCKGLGAMSFGRLMNFFGSMSKAAGASAENWQHAGISVKKYAQFRATTIEPYRHTLEHWLSTDDHHHLLSYACNAYPQAFKHLPDPPVVLYVNGDVSALHKKAIAMIGSRRASPSGIKIAQQMAYELTRQSFSIISGLALGIDVAAHQGCLACNGQTVAFLGTGLKVMYPKQHAEIARKIVQTNGALVSELRLDMPPKASNFPPRNRLISMLSLATVVVECTPRSGSMITAKAAIDQGKEVFAVPGSIFSEQSLGCHQLIQQGAYLVTNADDILTNLPKFEDEWVNLKSTQNVAEPVLRSPQQGFSETLKSPAKTDSFNDLTEQQKRVLEQVGFEHIDLETLHHSCQLSHHKLQVTLLELEMLDLVKSFSGQRWQRIQ